MNSINNLLPILKKDYPEIKFKPGESFSWSSTKNTIFYTTHHTNSEHGVWSLLHELAHACLDHNDYSSDFDLIRLENETWQKACQIGKNYGISISSDHIQDCLDTYRDWLYKRAKCPVCGVVTLQNQDKSYRCFNCKTKWQVPKSSQKKIVKKIIK
jgi:hypothetical protein